MILTEHYEEAILELALKDAVFDMCMYNQKTIEFFEEYLYQLENNKLSELFEENFVEIINEEFYRNLGKYSGVLMEGFWTKSRSLSLPGYNNSLKTGRLNVPKDPKWGIKDWARDVPYRAGSAIRSGIEKAKGMYNRSSEAGTGFYTRNRDRLVNAKTNFMAGYNQKPKTYDPTSILNKTIVK